MKKIVMEKFAFFLAIFACAFTPITGGVGTNCNDQLYYFPVNPSFLGECTEIITLNHIVTIAESSVPTQPNEVLFAFAVSRPYGCPDVELACAVGYSRDQIELVNGFWQPKLVNGQLVVRKCCVRDRERQLR